MGGAIIFSATSFWNINVKDCQLAGQWATVNQLINNAVSFVDSYSKKHDVQVDCELSEQPLMLMAHGVEIEQAITNLLKNAVEASAAGTNVVVRSMKEPAGMIISVQDQGCGIPQAMIEKVFDPFFTHGRNGDGVGLGMSLVHRIVSDNDGTIEIDSDEGIGTTVYLKFPAFDAQPAVS